MYGPRRQDQRQQRGGRALRHPAFASGRRELGAPTDRAWSSERYQSAGAGVPQNHLDSSSRTSPTRSASGWSYARKKAITSSK